MEEPEASTDRSCGWTLGQGSCGKEPFQRAVCVKVDVDLVGAFPNWEQSSVLKVNEGVRDILTVKIRLYLDLGAFVKNYRFHLEDFVDVNPGTQD
jgi:hypothetical protein